MLGDKIKELRIEKQITQEELAKIVGITTASIGMYETNGRKPSYDVLNKIADYFGVSTDYLLGRNTESSDQSFLRVMQDAKNKGYDADDIRLALDFLDRARKRDN